MHTRVRGWLGLTAILSAFFAPVSGIAQTPEEFYKDKTVKLIVGYGPGGGYDVYARQLARVIGRYIPGKPAVVVQNMPGAGSLRAVNYLYNVAPKDGTVFGTFARNMPLLAILGENKNAKFDPSNFTWLGSSASYANDVYLMWVRKDSAVKSIDDIRTPGGPTLVLAGTGEGSSGGDAPVILRDALGLNLKQIMGYPDSAGLYLAVERKEVDGRVIGLSAVRSTKPDWFKPDSPVHVILQFGRPDRHVDFPNVPVARELAPDAKSKGILEFAEIPNQLSRPYAAPPGVPKDLTVALQKAFMDTHKDPDYLAEAKKLEIDVSPIDGAEVLRLIAQMKSAPPETLTYMRALFSANKEAK